MLKNKSLLKCERPYNGLYERMQKCTNGTFTLELVAMTDIYNIHLISTNLKKMMVKMPISNPMVAYITRCYTDYSYKEIKTV